jgi:hypothetical protein
MATVDSTTAPSRRASRSRLDRSVVLFLGTGIAATLLELFVTRFGIKITTDSATYLGVAHNLASGRGLTVPFVNTLDHFSPTQGVGFAGEVPLLLFGPLLSIVLAPFDRLGIDFLDVVPLLNSLLLGVTVGMVAVLTYRITRGSILLGVVAAALVVHAQVLQVFSFVESEPLYLALTLVALGCLARYLTTNRQSFLVGFVVLAGLAAVTRYIGVSMLLTGFLALLLWSVGSRRQRIARAFGAIALGAIPVLVFRVYESSLAGGFRRPLTMYSPPAANWAGIVDSLDHWIVPGNPYVIPGPDRRLLMGIVLGLLVVALIMLSVDTFARERRLAAAAPEAPETSEDLQLRESQMLVRVVAIALVSYLVVLAATRVFADASPSFQFGDRLLVPALPLVWILSVGVLGRAIAVRWSGATAKRAVAVVAGLGLVLAFAHLLNADTIIGWPDDSHAKVTSSPSPTWTLMRRYPQDTLIVTSDPAGAWFEDGFDAVSLPSRVWALTDTPNHRLDRDIAQVGRALERHGGYVVFTYGSVLFGPHLVSEAKLVDRLGLREVARAADGRVYELPGTNDAKAGAIR